MLVRIAVGVAVGLAMGLLLGRVLFRSRSRSLRLAEQGEGFVALAATFLAYGVAEALHGYGFLAVFVAACALRRSEHSHGYHQVMHGFVEQIERLLMALLLFGVGAYVASGGLAALTWKGAAVAVLLHLLIRPASGWLAQLRGPGARMNVRPRPSSASGASDRSSISPTPAVRATSVRTNGRCGRSSSSPS